MDLYSPTLAQVTPRSPVYLVLLGATGLIVLFFGLYMMTRYRRCKPNQILVVFGTIGGHKSARCLHGGGAFVTPLIQDYAYLSLEPYLLKIELAEMPTADGGSVSGVVSLTAQIGTDPKRMHNAAERLLGLERHQIEELIRSTAERELAGMFLERTRAELAKGRPQLRQEVRERLDAAMAAMGVEAAGLEITSFTLNPEMPASAAPARSLS